MKKKDWSGVLIVAIVLIVLVGFILINYKMPANASSLSEAEARVIAEKLCIKGGKALDSGIYNETSKTWWFNANFNAVREGCNPACVVSEETKTAEINWRCTGLVKLVNCTCPVGYRKKGEICNPECYYSTPPCLIPSFLCQSLTENETCGIENCHGLDIICGQNIAEVCTALYMEGDNCRQFASCEKKDGKCQLAYSSDFESCKSCVEKCKIDFPSEQNKFFLCESKCA